MRFYTLQHRFYCGIDLHARTLSLHILDAHGQTVLAVTLPASPQAFLAAVAPFRDGLVVGQTPSAGTQRKAGTLVTIRVARLS